MFTIELDSSTMRGHKRHFWNESSYACSWRVDLFCKHNFELQITFLQLPHISIPPLTNSTPRSIVNSLFNSTIYESNNQSISYINLLILRFLAVFIALTSSSLSLVGSLAYKSSTIYNSILKYETRPKLYKPKLLKKYRKRILFTQLNNYIEFHSLTLNMYFFTVKWEIFYRCKQLKNTYFLSLLFKYRFHSQQINEVFAFLF